MRHFLMTVAFFFAAAMAVIGQNSEDLLAVQSQAGSGYAFINERGQIVLPGPYQGGASFSEGLAAVNINGDWAYIDTSGKVVISDLHVRTAGSFVEGRAYVENFEGRYGFIDRTGRATVPPQLPTQLNCPFSNDVLGAQSRRRQLEEGNQQTSEVAH